MIRKPAATHRRGAPENHRGRSLRFETLQPRQMMAGDSVHFTFDYSKDNGFFSGANAFRRDLLDQAGRILTDRLNDDLAAVPASTAARSWQAQIINPSTGATDTLPSNFSVKANEIVVFVGSRNLSGEGADTRALATGLAGASFSCTVNDAACSAFVANLQTRGEAGAAGTRPSDFGPIVASVSFDNRRETTDRWNFEDSPVDDSQFRFVSFAVHELAHVLGFGLSQSFIVQAGGGRFSGVESNKVYQGSGVLPLDGFHLAQSVLNVQPTLMTPFITNTLPSELDFAVLDDIGWDVNSRSRPTVSLTQTSAVLLENNSQNEPSSITVTATLSQPAASVIEVPVFVSGVASTSSDVNLSANSFRFNANQTTATITINVVADTVNETTEAMTLELGTSIAVDQGENDSFRLTIFDDDGIDAPAATRLDRSPTANSVNVPANNQAHSFLFRADRAGTLSATAIGVDQISEAVILVDRNGTYLGEYGSTGLVSAQVAAGQSYALLFPPRSTNRTFALSLSGGFANSTNDSRTNVVLPPDVSGDGQVLPSDALRIINQLNALGDSIPGDSDALDGDDFYDVSGDGQVTPVDALQVINYLIIQDGFTGEPIASNVGLIDDDEDRFAAIDQALANGQLF